MFSWVTLAENAQEGSLNTYHGSDSTTNSNNTTTGQDLGLHHLGWLANLESRRK